jgi:predicted DNA-binding antitoxin AbrB/MazE fold protein
MQNVIEGIYHNGMIELLQNVVIPENKILKIIILEDKVESINDKSIFQKFDRYQLGKELDEINLRDFAYED